MSNFADSCLKMYLLDLVFFAASRSVLVVFSWTPLIYVDSVNRINNNVTDLNY